MAMQKNTKKIALISDIHGNYTALKAVINNIEKENIDSLICLGDVATIGPQPNEVLDILKTIDCRLVLGNHDEALLYPEKSLELRIPPPLIPSLDWCRQQLKQDDLNFLQSFQASLQIPFGSKDRLLCYHGSPQSNIKNILATTPESEMDQIFTQYASTLFAGGHTHIQMMRQHNGNLFINPGSVGMPFHHTPNQGEHPILLPFAEYAILYYFEENIEIKLHRISFDHAKYKKVINQSTLPIKDWLINKY